MPVSSSKAGFFEELKCRHAWRVAVACAVTAWLLLQLASIVATRIRKLASIHMLVIPAQAGIQWFATSPSQRAVDSRLRGNDEGKCGNDGWEMAP